MLNFTLKGTYQDSTGYSWDYYRDDQLDPNPDPNLFYIVPRPQFVLDASGRPAFQIVRYQTDDPATNGAGYAHFDVELSVPAQVEAAISAAILANTVQFPGVAAPRFASLDLNRGGMAYFNFADGVAPITFSATASSFGGDSASFLFQMTNAQLQSLIAGFETAGGTFEVEYALSVPARFLGVHAVLGFDSSIAYSYQVTQPSFNSWGDETSPGSVEALLNQSESSTVTITFGEADPPADLQQSVANWANGTLADLVTAEVQKVIQLQGLQSDNSFNINEVSSFTNTYAENTVVAWLISPTAALPSFPESGWNIADYTKVVDEQQQAMSVAVNLPFKSDLEGASRLPLVGLPGQSPVQALVDHVTVTVHYPGLPQADGTHTFTSNGAWTVATAYDETAGPVWSLDYQVTYVDPDMDTVSGHVAAISEGSYTLQVEAAGILTVVFDARPAFATESVPPVQIVVDLSFLNRTGTGHPIRQSVTIDAPPVSGPTAAGAGMGSITSYVADPIDTPYNYQLTYLYQGGVDFRPPLVQGATGFNVVIPAADAVHQTTLVVYEPATKTVDPIFIVSAQMYYAAAPEVPPGTVGSFPTKDSPAVFNIKPAIGTPSFASFTGLINGDQPLVYSATISAADPSIPVIDQPVANGLTVLQLSPNISYFTLQINPEAVQWSSATYDQIEVLVQMLDGGNTHGQEQSYIWNRNDSTARSQYLTTTALPGDVLTYNWTVNYVTAGKPVRSKSVFGAGDIVLNIPAAS